MSGREVCRRIALPVLAGFWAFCGSVLGAAGFSAADPGIKAMGLGGAFTARANDPSAGFFNPGGLALLKKGKLTVGLAGLSLNESQYQGQAPGIGQGTTGAQEKGWTLPAHAFTAIPLGEKMKLGVGIYTPFAFKTEWADPGSFAGRFLTTSGALETYDVNANLGLKITPNFGFGAGVIYRSSRFAMGRRVSGVNPANGQTVDVGSLDLETDYDTGIGWDAGFLHKIGERFAWGVSYRSPIDVDYAGAGRLTQISTGNAQLDQLNRATLPYDLDLPLFTSISFPETATLGIGFAPTEKTWIEADVTQTGWSRFEGLNVSFPFNSTFSRTVQGPWEDALSYRVGAQIEVGGGIQFRVGYGFEESPQPDASLAPLLPDAERNILSAGFGRDWLDIAFQLIAPQTRATATNGDGLNGSYKGNSYQVGISITK
ncbi:MAG TPA: outer membrane protein transport protein [Thermoanaerobaculia bacterium]|nr:outer membrane protein transport protein [Thermoanaerobaculia bacterium]